MQLDVETSCNGLAWHGTPVCARLVLVSTLLGLHCQQIEGGTSRYVLEAGNQASRSYFFAAALLSAPDTMLMTATNPTPHRCDSHTSSQHQR